MDSKVRVKEPAVGQETASIDNTQVTTGAGSVQRQTISIGDPDNGGLRALVTDAPPGVSDPALAVRVIGSVTSTALPNYDSGIQTLPSSLTSQTAVTTAVKNIFLSNITDQVQRVTITDGNGQIYLDARPIPARGEALIPFGDMLFTNGVKWFASHAGSVRGQINGDQ